MIVNHMGAWRTQAKGAWKAHPAYESVLKGDDSGLKPKRELIDVEITGLISGLEELIVGKLFAKA